jgi:hypothetical protein
MCVIGAKYFKDYGWVGFKNRDRNYKCGITFKQSFRDGIERLYLEDTVSKYTEGINEYGVCILSAATLVISDEKEGGKSSRPSNKKNKKKKRGDDGYMSPDGLVIRKALLEKTPLDVIKKLIELELKGNTLVFNKDKCYLFEGDYHELDKKKYELLNKLNPEEEVDYDQKFNYHYKEIPKDEVIVRTNHGIFLEYTGYPKDSDDEYMQQSRESSEKRYETTLKLLKKIKDPSKILDCVSCLDEKDFNLNPMRLGNPKSKKEMKTTGQIVLDPKNLKLIYRPIWCTVEFNGFDTVNNDKSKTFLDIISFNWNEVVKEGFEKFSKIKSLLKD